MAGRMRAFDWSETALGPPEWWPQNLRTAVGICLMSRFPMQVWWGERLAMFYNDAYISFLGKGKHPAVLGRSAWEAWPEIWQTIGPMIARAMTSGEASWSEDILMFFDRELPREEVYVTFSFSPILGSGEGDGVGGVFCACMETTDKLVGTRRLVTLRDLGVKAVASQPLAEVCQRCAEALGDNARDIPFAVIYTLDNEGQAAHLVASAGLQADGWRPPSVATLEGEEPACWPPLRTVLKARRTLEVEDLGAPEGELPQRPWSEPVRRALVLPIQAAASEHLAGLLVVGVSPRRPLDPAYRDFLDLVTAHLGSALTDARAYESERSRAEALAELDRAKTAFFTNISHEFRTPLTLMLGPLEEELRANPQAQARLEVVHRNSLRLLRLVNTLLEFSRIEAGRGHATFQATDLSTTTIELASQFRSAVDKAGLRLEIACPPLPFEVHVDRAMWEKILFNLLSSALKFTFEGGIGLALVKELVKLHGGELEVASVEGQGSCFTVRLPSGTGHLLPAQILSGPVAPPAASAAAAFVQEALLWTPAASAPEASCRSILGEGRPRILLADDNADMRDYLQHLMEGEYEVVAVPDGEAAFAAALACRPNLVLTDVMMPRLDGFGLLNQLRSDPRTRTLPVIFLSARAGEAARVDGVAQGADDYLVKPFTARELQARVSTHLALARVRGELEVELRRGREELEAKVAERTRELAQANALLEQRNAELDSFNYSVSHDLRGPVRIISSFARLLVQAHELNRTPESRYLLDGIITAGDRMARLIEDLLQFSRLDFLEVRRCQVDLSGMARSIVAALQGGEPGRRVAVSIEDHLTVGADEEMLRILVDNLLRNAWKFTSRKEAAWIKVGCRPHGGRAAFFVRDNGAGFNMAHVGRLFAPFQRLHTDQEFPGTGIGLAMSRRIVQRHGGTIWARGKVDRGAAIYFQFPDLAREGEA